MTNLKRNRRHKQIVATNSELAKTSFLQVITLLCNEASQPHPWIGKPDVLGEVLVKLLAAWMGADIHVDDNRRQ